MALDLRRSLADSQIDFRHVAAPARSVYSFQPMLCQSAENPLEGPGWRYEQKLDGFRSIGRKSGRSAQLWSRNQKDFTRRFPAMVKSIAGLPDDTVIDGEIVLVAGVGDSVPEPRQDIFELSTTPPLLLLHFTACYFCALLRRSKPRERWRGSAADKGGMLATLAPLRPLRRAFC
jgi:hypothetical protein